MTNLPVVSLVAAGLLLAAGCGGDSGTPSGGGSATAEGVTVTLKSLAFAPAELTVSAGTTVTWRSDEPIGHTVTSGEPTGIDPMTGLRADEKPDGRFDVQLATTGATHSFRFTSPGNYPYYCAIHQGMNARVLVS